MTLGRNSWAVWLVVGVAALGGLLAWGLSELGRPGRGVETDSIVDFQKLRLVEEPRSAAPDDRLECDILIAGGGLGGVAAALGACERGRTVVLTEETDWLGGQLSTQGVSAPDDHRYIERFGGTRLYYDLRTRIRNYYRSRFRLKPLSQLVSLLSPGRGWVSRLTFEPRAGAAVVDEMLEPYVHQGLLTIYRRHKAVRAEMSGNRVGAVHFRHLDSDEHLAVQAAYVLDATELGDLLPLTGAEYVFGAETKAETGEPTARADRRREDCAQSFGYPFGLERQAQPGPPVPPPARYLEFRQRQPYTFAHDDGSDSPPTFRMFVPGINADGAFWNYRRALAAGQFDDPGVTRDRAVVLFAGNDYHWGWLVDQPPARMLATLREAKELARGFCHWLQKDLPRDEGRGTGYPELQLCQEMMGTPDGFAKFPYIREGRRIVPLKRIVEQEIGSQYLPKTRRAALFADSVGIGWHQVDLHPGPCNEALAAQKTRPFQIPLRALVPKRIENLLPACKNIGTTHITNGAYRMHPIEWNIGESAGRIAAWCIEVGLTPRQLAADPAQVRRLQAYLISWDVPLFWLLDVPLSDDGFDAVQLLSTWGLWPAAPKDLNFHPERLLSQAEASALLKAARTDPGTTAAITREAGLSLPHTSVPVITFANAWLAAVYPMEGS